MGNQGQRRILRRSLAHQHSRKRTFRIHKKGKLRESVGILSRKKGLGISLLNVDGLSDDALLDVENTLVTEHPDICILLETKRRFEDDDTDIAIDGYDVLERKRSDAAGDKAGGGLAMFTRRGEGLVYKEHSPRISNPAHAFVNNERMWVTVQSHSRKTAVCAVYMGFQAQDDRHGDWNDIIYDVLRSEIHDLREAGYRVVLKGDFNAHVGSQLGEGIVGNHDSINRNGVRFLNFLRDINGCHVNGACRVDGDWSTRISKGLWSRQRGGVSTVLDYGVILLEHLSSVKSFVIDDQGVFPTSSDHNWSFMELEDEFVVKGKVPSNRSVKKKVWNFGDDFDWTSFTTTVEELVGETNFELMGMDDLAKVAAEILLRSAEKNIGLKESLGKQRRYTRLPRDMVDAFEMRDILGANYKTKSSALASADRAGRTEERFAALSEAERLYNEQKALVSTLLCGRRFVKRTKVLKACKGDTVHAIKTFWSYISSKGKNTTPIDCVLSPTKNMLVHENEQIMSEVEDHLVRVFHGSMEPIVPDSSEDCIFMDHSYASATQRVDDGGDHCYGRSSSPSLPVGDDSASIRTDPQGWLDKKFSVDEVVKNVQKLKNSKAKGFDNIPNEFIKNSGHGFHVLLTALYNKVKEAGRFPAGWNRGRICLIHKKGARELLGNYRPLTVIVSLSGLYSRILNERLTQVVETHNLLGEVQNGFRRGRMASDNAFILDTILWKAKAKKQKVNFAFFDVAKAYDTVDRDILWRRMSSLGFGGEFLDSIKSIYSGDSVQCTVNGLTTRPVFLRRGLRQGCSLSPMLFNLYIAGLGNALSLSEDGFQVGGCFISALFFADDLVVIARDREGLLRLMKLVKTHTDWLRLEINTGKDKSEVLAQEGAVGDQWEVLSDDGDIVLSLKQVLEYRYLGTQVQGSMFKTAVRKVKQCVSKAHKYKGSCIYISRDGPDVVDMILATWCNVAVPAILFGCEMIPFSESAICEIERVQSQIAKYALGLPLGSASVCAQVELGIKPFRQVLYETQLKFYARVLCLEDSRWVKQAMQDHLSVSWKSPYVAYIHRIRLELGLYALPLRGTGLLTEIGSHFLSHLNGRIADLALPWIRPVKRLKRLQYAREGANSEAISAFRYDSADIGNKYPRLGRVEVQRYCPLCPVATRNTVMHLTFFCHSMELFRRQETTMSSFRNMCVAKGFSEDYVFELFVNGYDWNENPVPIQDFLARGFDLRRLRESFLSRW